MSFDVPKLVQSPGCDHGHNKESRNGRDIKIDILDGYIRTPGRVLGYFGENQSVGGFPDRPGRTNGPHGP